MINKIEEKNDKINDVINTLTYYKNYQKQEQEELTLPLDRDEKVDEKQGYNFSKPLEAIEKSVLDDLSDSKKVFLYKKKDGKDVYSNVTIIGVNNLIKAADDELNNEYKSPELKSLSNKLVAYYRHNKNNQQVLMYRNAIGKYQNLIKDILASRKYIPKNKIKLKKFKNLKKKRVLKHVTDIKL